MKAPDRREGDSRENWRRFVATRDPELRCQLILEHVHLVENVVRAAGWGRSSHLDREDLVGEGMLGLIDAVDRFDPERGLRFSIYATLRIRGQILDSLRARDLLPRPARRRVKQLGEAVSALTGESADPLTDAQLAERLRWAPSQLRRTRLDANAKIQSMDEPLGDDGQGPPLRVFLKAPDECQPAVLQEMSEVREQIRDALRQLPQRQQILLSLYYCEELTMTEIGHVLGVCESRVSQLHAQAIQQLRALLRSSGVLATKQEPQERTRTRNQAANPRRVPAVRAA